ncbi:MULTISPECIES: hypothetical protein [unclassified Actinomyces]|uniref:hypothetical protein n=1 Tax=unclassified Actinomyces TaxID=2609248 RepID=UPI0011BDCFA0|nr:MULTISPECIES: hypothetical protein [unclassified Actinomyces]
MDASPVDDDASPASASVTPPRRPSTEVLRGLRFGALAIAVIASVWAWQQANHYYHVFSFPEGDIALPVVPSVVILPTLAWGAFVCSDRLARPSQIQKSITLLTVAVASLLTSVLFAGSWWGESQDIQMSYPALAQLAVAAIALGAAGVADILIRDRRNHHAKPRSRRIRLLRPTRSATISAVLALAVGAAALALPAGHYATESVQVPAAPTQPAPEYLSDSVTWQRSIQIPIPSDTEPIVGVIAGAAGPIVITDHGAMGLDPSTGETTWSYTRGGMTVKLGYEPCWDNINAWCYAAVSPDRSRLVLGYDAGRLGTPLVVLDTTTGEVAFEYVFQYYSSSRIDPNRIQVTDHVLRVDDEILSLSDGSLQATLPFELLWDYDKPSYCRNRDISPCRFIPGPTQGGHSTLVYGAICHNPGKPEDIESKDYDYRWCELITAPDDDPTTVTLAEGVAAAPDEPEYIGGWTVHYADPDAAYAELSRHQDPEEVDTLSFPLEAVSLDTLAGVDDAEPVTLGSLNRPEYNRSTRTLAVLGAAAPTEKATVQARFDPVTRTVYHVDDAGSALSGPGYLDDLQATEPDEQEGIDLVRSDGTAALHLDYYSEDPAPHTSYSSIDVPYLVQAPGVITVIDARIAWDSSGDVLRHELVIYGVG